MGQTRQTTNPEVVVRTSQRTSSAHPTTLEFGGKTMNRKKQSSARIGYNKFLQHGPVVELAEDFDDSESEILEDFCASYQREAKAIAAETSYESRS
jgi:hypothetical protein